MPFEISLPPIGPSGGLSGVKPLGGAGATRSIESGESFGDKLAAGLDHLQELQTNTDEMAVKAATGDIKDVHDLMIQATEANLALDLTVAVRNKALESFNEIMRMQI